VVKEREAHVKVKMPWMKARLRELGRTPAGLARHLGIAAPRVYEMIAGRRGMQPDEIAEVAKYLEWPIEEVVKRLPEGSRNLPHDVSAVGSIPVLGQTRTYDICGWDSLLTGDTVGHVDCKALTGRTDVRCLYMVGDAMLPWRDSGEPVLFETGRPPKDNDYVVIYLAGEDRATPKEYRNQTRVLIRRLLASTGKKLRLMQLNPKRTTEIDRKAVASVYRVLTWEDCIR